MTKDPKFQPVHALWDQLALAGTADIDGSARHLIETVSGWIGADCAAWIGTIHILSGAAGKKDALCGWRVRTIVFHPPPTEAEARIALRIQKSPSREPGMTAVATAKLAGTFRVHRLRDGFVDFDELVKTEHYQVLYEQLGVRDRIWVGAPVSEDAEVYFVFDRRANPAPFTAEEAQLAGYTMRGLTWFHRRLLYSHGLVAAEAPLTATERSVMQLLLTDKSEKEIAATLGQSPHTTHDHAKEIYRKFGVSGRTGLMAIWLANM